MTRGTGRRENSVAPAVEAGLVVELVAVRVDSLAGSFLPARVGGCSCCGLLDWAGPARFFIGIG
jgi:hypothetical protein